MHNGYTNYETWTVANVLANDESLYNFSQALLAETASITDSDKRKVEIIKVLRNLCISMQPNTTNHIWGPIINSVITDRINFAELADTLLEDKNYKFITVRK